MMDQFTFLSKILFDVFVGLKAGTTTLLRVFPWIIVAVGVSSLIRHLDFGRKIAGYAKRSPRVSVLGSALLGSTLPVCSCTVLPLARGLLRAGVPIPVMIAFWASAPIISVRKFFTVSAVLGPKFGATLLLSALAIGVCGAFVVRWTERRGIVIFEDVPSTEKSPSGCGCKSGNLKACNPGRSIRAKVKLEILKLLRELFRILLWLYFAFVLESLFSAWIPLDWVPSVLGGGNWFAIPTAVLIGAPLYFNYIIGLALASSLFEAGASQGAALSLLVAGSMTSIPAVFATINLLGKKLFLWYMGIAFVGSSSVGIVFNLVASG